MKITTDSEAWNLVPKLKKNVELGNVLYEGIEKSDKTATKIEEMESITECELKVIAVIRRHGQIAGDNVVMTSYVFIENNAQPDIITNPGHLKTACFYARVINETWDIDEYGSVGLIEIEGETQRAW